MRESEVPGDRNGGQGSRWVKEHRTEQVAEKPGRRARGRRCGSAGRAWQGGRGAGGCTPWPPSSREPAPRWMLGTEWTFTDRGILPHHWVCKSPSWKIASSPPGVQTPSFWARAGRCVPDTLTPEPVAAPGHPGGSAGEHLPSVQVMTLRGCDQVPRRAPRREPPRPLLCLCLSLCLS